MIVVLSDVIVPEVQCAEVGVEQGALLRELLADHLADHVHVDVE
jgi:hypothetical protein